MIIRDGEYKINAIPQMKGGIGQFVTEEMVPPEYLGKVGTLFVRGTLAPGDSVGMHTHVSNMEVCVFLRGAGLVRDAQAGDVRLGAGDTHICLPGSAHEIINDGDEPLVYLAIVLNP